MSHDILRLRHLPDSPTDVLDQALQLIDHTRRDASEQDFTSSEQLRKYNGEQQRVIDNLISEIDNHLEKYPRNQNLLNAREQYKLAHGARNMAARSAYLDEGERYLDRFLKYQ